MLDALAPNDGTMKILILALEIKFILSPTHNCVGLFNLWYNIEIIKED